MIRELFSYIGKKGRASMIAAIIAETGNSILSAAIMLVVFRMLYAVIDTSAAVSDYFLPFAMLLVGKFICTTVSMVTTHVAGFEVEVKLKARVIARLKQFSLGFFTNAQLGTISTVVHDDVDSLEKATAHMGSRMLADIITAAAIGVCLFVLDWRMGLVMISLLPIGFVLQKLGFVHALHLKRITAASLSRMVSRFVEFMRNIPMLKSFPGGKLFEDTLKDSAADFSKNSKAEARQGAKDTAAFFIPLELCFALVAIVGAFWATGDSLSANNYIYFIVFSQLFYLPFANMESYRLTWTQIQSAYGRIRSLLHAPVISSAETPEAIAGHDIEFANVGFAYEAEGFALHDVSFHVPEGGLAALVGPSGSGKTTILNLLLRFWDCTEGQIKIGGADIRNADYDVLLSKISIVMQDVILFKDTIYENIRTGNPNATQQQIEDAAKKAMLHDFIMTLPNGYDTMLGENGARLSGGERQRLSIARAFLKDAPILLLDEMSSNLDSLNEVLLQKAISELSKGRTVLMIAHRLQTIRSAENILVFDGGKIAENGLHDELMQADGLYARLWNAQAGAGEWRIA